MAMFLSFRALWRSLIITSLLTLSWHANALPLKNFDVEFDVRVLGFKVGTAYQNLHCDAEGNCLLTSEAKPPSWARRFINEESIEKTRLKQTKTDLTWLEYKKYLTRHYDDETIHKTYTLVRNPDKKQIDFLEEKKHWPEQKHVYDMISMAYGVQFMVLTKQSLDNLYLQDDKVQQRFRFTTKFEDDEIELPFEEEAQTKLFEFHNGKIDAQLWLMPSLNYFPVRIIILNKEEDRKIELELKKQP